jgi:tRNA 2-thiouridine synthesizing protein A
VLDLRGEVCPYTFVYTRLKLEELALGASLAILVDHEPATRNVPRSAREWGQAVDVVEPFADGGWRIVVRKQVA